jgi:hypothetical protein
MTDDPDFYAWLDGELAEPKASAMAAKVAADPELSAFAQQHRALGSRLTAAFAHIAHERVPEHLLAAAKPGADVIDLAAARERRTKRWTITGVAMAASLALGVTLGVALPQGSNASFQSRGDRLAAAGPLGQALNTQQASAGDKDGIRIGLSFKDQSGRYCRTFTSAAQSGLACRSGNGWLIDGLVAGEPQTGDYRMAAGSDPALGILIDSRIRGNPLDPSSEAAAIEAGWR